MKAAVSDIATDAGRSGLERVRRIARSSARFLLQPDAQVLWLPAALRRARKLIQQTRHDAILVTAPPYSSLLLGSSLHRQTRLPLVCDFRDEWDISQAHLENAPRGHLSRQVQRRMQNRVLRDSAAVIATTEYSRAHLLAKAAAIGHAPLSATIYNGWDPVDFNSDTGHEPQEPNRNGIHLTYTGTLWNLTDITPLVKAVQMISSRNRNLLGSLWISVIGRCTAEQERLLGELSAAGTNVEQRGYLPHAEATRAMISASHLLLLLADVPEARRVIPGKLFEYLAANRPILSIAPEGECSQLVAESGGHWFLPSDHTGIARWLEQALADPLNPAHDLMSKQVAARFTRRTQAERLAGVLDRVVAAGPVKG